MNQSSISTVPVQLSVGLPQEFHPYEFDYLGALQIIHKQANQLAEEASDILFEYELAI
jgi:hypothetical protein